MRKDLAIPWVRRLAVTSLVALALAQGCANLTAIRDFGAISAETASYQALVQDYVDAPVRLKRFESAAVYDAASHDT